MPIPDMPLWLGQPPLKRIVHKPHSPLDNPEHDHGEHNQDDYDNDFNITAGGIFFVGIKQLVIFFSENNHTAE